MSNQMNETGQPRPIADSQHAAAPTEIRFELHCGYTRLTFTPQLTRVSVAPMHRSRRDALAMAALMIRADLAKQGAITRRLQGSPKIAEDGTIRVVLTDRLGRRHRPITVTPADIVAHLRNWMIA
ncbi:hypothetical protein ACQP1G_20265 [Nocardia sp. CA-107356]|uniref:hypothetical protein n=1 Tax=Nocardia sp. CA-107356 TaxID=3239972 RepID=UPI003D9448F0